MCYDEPPPGTVEVLASPSGGVERTRDRARFQIPNAEDVSRVHGKEIFALSCTQDESVVPTFKTNKLSPFFARNFLTTAARTLGYGSRAGQLDFTQRPLLRCTEVSDRKSTRLNSSHLRASRMPSSA